MLIDLANIYGIPNTIAFYAEYRLTNCQVIEMLKLIFDHTKTTFVLHGEIVLPGTGYMFAALRFIFSGCAYIIDHFLLDDNSK